MSDTPIVDLNALVPQPRVVKFGDQEITINPPRTADVLRLGFLGQAMQTEAGGPGIDKVVDDVTALIRKCVPELGDAKLETPQILTLIQILSEMSIPPEAKELEARGITVDTPKKAQ